MYLPLDFQCRATGTGENSSTRLPGTRQVPARYPPGTHLSRYPSGARLPWFLSKWHCPEGRVGSGLQILAGTRFWRVPAGSYSTFNPDTPRKAMPRRKHKKGTKCVTQRGLETSPIDWEKESTEATVNVWVSIWCIGARHTALLSSLQEVGMQSCGRRCKSWSIKGLQEWNNGGFNSGINGIT